MASASPKAAVPTTKRPRARKSIAHMPSPDKMLDQENTDRDPLSLSSHDPPSQRPGSLSRKMRSKSFGPGGLEALKETTGNRRKFAIAPLPKSILKPTVPLSPIKEIPTRRPHGKDSKPSSPMKPGRPTSSSGREEQAIAMRASSVQDRVNDSAIGGAPNSQNTNDQEEKQAQDAELEEKQKRKAEIQKQRDARRKSMANRRVSFAPEATLHTWDTEVLQDSTTSSASTESTRRASAFGQSQGSISAQPKTPTEQIEDPLVPRSPEHQRSAHQQKRRRRSSGIPAMNFNDPTALSSSPYSGSSAVSDDDTITSPHRKDTDDATTSGSEDGGDMLGDATMESIDGDTAGEGGEQDDAHEELDASLQDAAERAGTRSIETDENGDVSMDIAGDDVTAAFRPWVRQSTGIGSPHPAKALPRPGEEKINPFSPAFRQAAGTNGSPAPSTAGNDDMSMDITRAVGGILQPQKNTTQRRTPNPRRQSIARQRRSSGSGSELGDGTMEFTTALGGLQPTANEAHDQSQFDENEDLSIEFTSVFGGLKSNNDVSRQQQHLHEQQQSIEEVDEDGDMEMTTSVGNILHHGKDDQQPIEAANGAAGSKVDNDHIGETAGQQRASARKATAPSPASLRKRAAPKPRHSISASATGSPAVVSSNQPHYAQATIASSVPSKTPRTPSHQLTPEPGRPMTPGKTPPSANVSMRKTSPKKLFQQEIREAKSPKAATPSLFRRDSGSGQQTPSVVLAHKSVAQKMASGVGIDKQGLGSPRVAALLDRRTSIGDNADVFAPSGPSRGVKFDDPREMDFEVSRQRDEDQRRESGKFIMEQEAEGVVDEEKDATTNLKEMMQSMTPKKNKLKGRKSLAVGGAKGVLGKRPVELDESDNEGSPRTFGKAGSPIKKVRLQDPPSFAETTGTSTRSAKQNMTETSGNARPRTPRLATSPGPKQASTRKSQGRFKDAETLASAQEQLPSLGQRDPKDAEEEAQEAPDDKIGLQEFLNLTNIRFMELTTTKRRPTMAPANRQGTGEAPEGNDDPFKVLENAVVAGACTIPMLELYQHSCRELKKYISEGRSIVRSIEEETLQENPPLFREYLSASPSNRHIMDNQFKNMKTNARLLSKATWYEWRMKLLEGLNESLNDTARGLGDDDAALKRSEDAIAPLLPEIKAEHASLEREHTDLKARSDELAACDPEDLSTARERLQTVTVEIEAHAHSLEAHQESLTDLDAQIEAAQETKRVAEHDARKAQKQREESRGWSAAEVKSLQSRVDALTAESGWAVVGASGSTLTLHFEKQLSLSFNTTAFAPQAASSAPTGLSLAYIGAGAGETEPTTNRFFIQFLRAHLHALPAASTSHSQLLKLVASVWRTARAVERQIAFLKLRVGPTEPRIVGDERLGVESEVLLPGVSSKVCVGFEIVAGVVQQGEDEDRSLGVQAQVEVHARVVYGEGYRQDRMGEFVKKRISGVLACGLEEEEGAWADAVVELKKGLVRRGAK